MKNLTKVAIIGILVMLIVGCSSSGSNSEPNSNYAYISDFSHLKIVDITDSQNPTIVGSVNIPTSGNIALNGNYAYVSQFDGTKPYLSIVDISNHSNPIVINTVDKSDKNRIVSDMLIEDDVAYISDAFKGIHIVDVSNGNFIPHSTIRSNKYTFSLTKAGNRIYSINKAVDGMEVLTKNNPYSLSITNITNSNDIDTGLTINHSIVKHTPNAKIVVANFTDKKLKILDPVNLNLQSSVYLGGYPSGLAVTNNFAFVTMKPVSQPYNVSFNGIKVVNLNNMNITYFNALSYPVDVAVYDNKAYIIDADGLHIYSIDSNGGLTLISTLNMYGAQKIKLGD